MVAQNSNTEQVILDAAHKVFIRKGLAGARMQEIADEAGINKALLHYYFRGKDQLFEAVFAQVLANFLPVIKNVLEKEMPFREKIILFVETYTGILLANPHIPAFIIQELNTYPGRFVDKLKIYGIKPDLLFNQIQIDVSKGVIREIRGDHFVVNLLGMCLFPFIARPVVQGMLQKTDNQYELFLKERKEEIVEFITHSIALS
jgi:TetR/AcrR family transcriptional regulator